MADEGADSRRVLDYAAPRSEGDRPDDQPVDRRRVLARDFLAFGSWIFYILILGRAMIAPYRPFVDQLIIAAALLLLITWLYRNYNGYLARGTILAVSLIPFYADVGFSIFVILGFIGLIISVGYLGTAWKPLIAGLIIGGLCIGLAFPLAEVTRRTILPDLGDIPAHRQEQPAEAESAGLDIGGSTLTV